MRIKQKRKYIVPLISLILVILLMMLFFYYHGMTDAEKLKWTKREVTPWGQDLIGVDITAGSKEKVKVAILDSGINDSHEDLAGKVKKKYNTFDDSNETIDEFNHGTAIAGIISANNNDVGIIGLNQNVEFYDVKVLNQEGHGKIEQLIKGIRWSIEQDVDLINLSFGFQTDSDELRNIIQEAISSGIIIVSAAGNTFNLAMDYPAQYSDVVSVNAIGSDLNLIDAAALGDTDFVAPGEDILSTNSQGQYSLFSGTSFAAAYTTGALSYWLGEFKNSSKYEEKNTKKTLIDFIESNNGIKSIKDDNKSNILKIN